MACYSPLDAWKSDSGEILFKDRGGGRHLVLPCGACFGCRLEKSRQWAIRCMHESQLYDWNSFVTLTYREEDCPFSLKYKHFQLFMRRLRRVRPGVRFYMAGEYGDRYGRPHYHACLFNCFFPDRVPWRNSPSGFQLYRSDELDDLWSLGFAEIGDVTFESAAYVARYVMKKVNGERKDAYARVDAETGELVEVAPEFSQMSRNPGIGSDWIKKYYTDVYPADVVMVNGMKCKPPRFYDGVFAYFRSIDDVDYDRFARALLTKEDNAPDRLRVREICARARMAFSKRTLE